MTARVSIKGFFSLSHSGSMAANSHRGRVFKEPESPVVQGRTNMMLVTRCRFGKLWYRECGAGRILVGGNVYAAAAAAAA